ncbi:unnamed protein product [Polarella glacialis]|uniref:Amino acid transporter transmembrane domain-containing protein n=1 Tax=Polarella glacialis TaxID=89957 RepID=A0A813FP56_POLGL|nr:unnamed protein product [Polarella glacialis]|mmetsp:Transcript_17469/g.27940  ORF Transcript_17469/g.27940 Transcript_17469/m.27940 type:complete len:505 (-) Transcript_17469:304-1818(-)
MDAPQRRSSWLGTSWIMLTDIVGTSVLTFAGVARQLGWVLTIVFIIGLSTVSVYTAVLMSRTRSILARTQDGKDPHSMGEASRLTLGSERVATAVTAVVYGYAFLGQSSYILVLGQSLQGFFWEHNLCLPTATAAACLLCIPVAISVRTLADSTALCLANLFLILAVLGIVMSNMMAEGRPADVNTYLFAPDLTLVTALGAMGNVVYAYCGHWLYFELMAEMKEPEQFPKVFLINGPLQVGLYLLVACWGYYYAGDKAEGYFLDNLPNGEAYRWASLLLFFHVAIAFMVKNIVLTRFVHSHLSPSRSGIFFSQPGGGRAQAEYASCSVFLLCISFFVANAIPFFSDLLGLIGALLSGPISFLLPMAFLVGCIGKDRFQAPEVESGSPWPGSCQLVSVQAQGSESGGSRAVQQDDAEAGQSAAKKWLRSLGGLARIDRVLCSVIVCLTITTMVLGTSDTVQDIVRNISTYGAPFSCQAAHRSDIRGAAPPTSAQQTSDFSFWPWA